MKPTEFTLTLGALADNVSVQLKAQGLSLGDGAIFYDEDARQIARLSVRGLLSDSETVKARQRLMKSIRAKLEAAP